MKPVRSVCVSTPMSQWSAPGRIRVGCTTRNLTLGANTNHTLRLANLSDEAKLYALVEKNISDLDEILRWSAPRGIELFRVGQSFVPFASHPQFPYDWQEMHGEKIATVGALARSLGIRLSMHPGQFVAPASPDPEVRERSLRELRYSRLLLDTLGAPDGVMVLHVGGVYGDREGVLGRLCDSLLSEPDILRYLALENDERLWNVSEAAQAAEALGVPLVLDVFHHRLNSGGLPLVDALEMALQTWKRRGWTSVPKIHLSSQSPEKRAGAHDRKIHREDFRELLDAFLSVENKSALDLMIEAKDSDLAALDVISLFSEHRKEIATDNL